MAGEDQTVAGVGIVGRDHVREIPGSERGVVAEGVQFHVPAQVFQCVSYILQSETSNDIQKVLTSS